MSIIYKPADTIAAGRYEIIRLIGEGGLGVVYLGKDNNLLKEIAIKVLRPELVEDKRQIDIFKREAELIACLHHPNIVAIYQMGTDTWQEKNIHYLVMEYLSGGNLTAQIRSGHSFDQAIKWIKQLLNAIGHAHEKGIIHQDIKSANVFLNSAGDIKIGDFGLASFAHGSSNTSNRKMGTPAYMSPELCFGDIQDERSDIYSLGILFFEMLTGQMPFEAEGMIELARQHVSKPVPSLCVINPKVPNILDEIVGRMMAKDKDERFQSTKQILSLLESL